MIIKEYPNSTAIRAMSYDRMTENFYVEFLSGDLWRYKNVTEHWAERIFSDAEDLGAGESYQYNVKGKLGGEKTTGGIPQTYPTHQALAVRITEANVAREIIAKLWDRGWRPNPDMGLFSIDEWAAHVIDINVEELRAERNKMVEEALNGLL